MEEIKQKNVSLDEMYFAIGELTKECNTANISYTRAFEVHGNIVTTKYATFIHNDMYITIDEMYCDGMLIITLMLSHMIDSDIINSKLFAIYRCFVCDKTDKYENEIIDEVHVFND